MPAGKTSEKLKRRYKDAYNVSSSTILVGTILKGLGILVGIGLSILVIYASDQSARQFGPSFAFPGVIFALINGLIIYIMGILISAQGQMLMAVLDTAVNTSPYLTQTDQEEIVESFASPPEYIPYSSTTVEPVVRRSPPPQTEEPQPTYHAEPILDEDTERRRRIIRFLCTVCGEPLSGPEKVAGRLNHDGCV